MDEGIEFEEKGVGHLVIETEESVLDYWTTTGLYKNRKDGRKGKGVQNLIKIVKREG